MGIGDEPDYHTKCQSENEAGYRYSIDRHGTLGRGAGAQDIPMPMEAPGPNVAGLAAYRRCWAWMRHGMACTVQQGMVWRGSEGRAQQGMAWYGMAQGSMGVA